MVKETNAKEYRKRNEDDLKNDLKKLREELQNIKFVRQTGTAVTKLNKIKGLRRQIARVLTIIREKRKEVEVKNLLTKFKIEKKRTDDGKKTKIIKTAVKTIKNLKMKRIPLDLRPKLTRAMRKRLTPFERKLVTIRQLKRKLNFPQRKFAVPADK